MSTGTCPHCGIREGDKQYTRGVYTGLSCMQCLVDGKHDAYKVDTGREAQEGLGADPQQERERGQRGDVNLQPFLKK